MKPDVFKAQPTERQLKLVYSMLYLIDYCIDEDDLPDIEDKNSVSQFISKYINRYKVAVNLYECRVNSQLKKFFKEIDEYMCNKYDFDINDFYDD